MSAADFWRPWEQKAESFDQARDIIHSIFEKWTDDGRSFAWRGQVDASWPLHSSLYRRLFWTEGSSIDESRLYDEEGKILAEFHRWGLHRGISGRLSVLNQLAVMQHFGAPTRLVDVSFSPYIGLWFAVEKKWSNTTPTKEDVDGRLFAFDVTDRLINENADKRDWEDCRKRPWRPSSVSADDWCDDILAWRPPRFEDRISAQHGGFLMGGVPKSWVHGSPRQWPKTTSSGGKWFQIDEVRSATSLPLRVLKLDSSDRGVRKNAVYTVRITPKGKADIRKHLEKLYGYRHATIYPDPTGFAQFAVPQLKSAP